MEKYGSRYLVTKKMVAILFLTIAALCVLVGVVVYFAGVSGGNSDPYQETQCKAYSSSNNNPEPEPEPEPIQKRKTQKVQDVRLPRHLLPINYRIELVPFLIPDNFTIRGLTEIEMDCVESAFNVTLHTADMLIQNDTIEVKEEDGKRVEIFQVDYDLDREFIIINLNSGLSAGKKYFITIRYTAHLRDSLKGFYRSVYKDKSSGEDQDEYLGVTQFQATDARRAFPCFDEPAIKATYQVSLGRRRDMSSMSNMPIKEEGLPMEGSSEYVWDRYEQSVKMSTYLVAFVVSKFKYVEETREK